MATERAPSPPTSPTTNHCASRLSQTRTTPGSQTKLEVGVPLLESGRNCVSAPTLTPWRPSRNEAAGSGTSTAVLLCFLHLCIRARLVPPTRNPSIPSSKQATIPSRFCKYRC